MAAVIGATFVIDGGQPLVEESRRERSNSVRRPRCAERWPFVDATRSLGGHGPSGQGPNQGIPGRETTRTKATLRIGVDSTEEGHLVVGDTQAAGAINQTIASVCEPLGTAETRKGGTRMNASGTNASMLKLETRTLSIAESRHESERSFRPLHVVVLGNRIVSTGYNGTPEGMTNCNQSGCYRRAHPELYESGKGYDVCICVHAEQKARLTAARFGIQFEGADVYTTSRRASAA